MKYAIYYTWNDGFNDTIDVKNATERDINIKEMISRDDFISISYAKKYNNGEIGKKEVVL